jgi:outer membrane protein assembly factor BamA
MGAVVRYDSRDVTVNAWKGLYLDAQALLYGPYLGGDNAYQMVMVDYRQYHRINHRDGRVLAWQMVSRMTFGEVPYGEMSQLGSPFGLRGYTWGQYRDKSMWYLMAEYRHTFLKGSGQLSRHGAVVWVGAGSIYDLEDNGYTSGAETNRLLPNAGLGYRLEVQPRLNMRLDFGIGRKTTGFYFNIVEAF